MSEAKHFYVTTPIYYVNDVPHIGHAYTTLACDVVARYKRARGFAVSFLTGTDEHGQKVEKAAHAKGETPLELADRVVKRFQSLWDKLNISHTDFIRTSQERHKLAVQDIFRVIEAKGDIYLGEYEDWYCTPCETFWTETQLLDGNCPDCGRPTDKLKEESYFFRMSKYQEQLLAHIEANPDFIQPKTRRNEILSFVREGLRDLSISRTTFSWGIPVPDNEKHVIYVWFDALTNYISALGYPNREEEMLILNAQATTGEKPSASAVVSPEQILEARGIVNEIYLDPKISSYIIDLVFCTREPDTHGLDELKPLIQFGASPRATIFLTLAAKAWAFLNGRGYVTPQDVKTIAPDILRHRIMLTYEAEAEEWSTESVVQRILETVPVP